MGWVKTRDVVAAVFAATFVVAADAALARWGDTELLARQWVGPREYVATVSATQTNTAVSFGFEAADVLVVNDGANEVFLTLASATATTSKFEVKSGETFSARLNSPVEGMGLVCSSGETATVRVGAWR